MWSKGMSSGFVQGSREEGALFQEIFANPEAQYPYAHYLSCLIECCQHLYGLKDALGEKIAEEVATLSRGAIHLYLHQEKIGNDPLVPYISRYRPFLVQWGEKVYGSLHCTVNEASGETILPAIFCERLARDCGWCLHVLEQEAVLQRQSDLGREEALKKIEGLSQAQYTVLQLMVKGLSTRGIADSLHLSKRTVETHQRYIYQELDVHSQREAILIGLAAGLRPN